MNRSTLFVLAAASVLVLSSAIAEAGPLRHTQRHQAQRIRQGVGNGDLTAGERRALVHEQRRIRRERERALADGSLDAAEARRIHRMQRRLSRHIYGLRHDGDE